MVYKPIEMPIIKCTLRNKIICQLFCWRAMTTKGSTTAFQKSENTKKKAKKVKTPPASLEKLTLVD